MPTADPSVVPAALATVATIFTGNYTVLLAAAVALIAIVTIPLIVIRGGVNWVLRALGRLFRVGHTA